VCNSNVARWEVEIALLHNTYQKYKIKKIKFDTREVEGNLAGCMGIHGMYLRIYNDQAWVEARAELERERELR